MAEPQNAPYIFISYASADRERVMPVVDALRRVGVPVWLDQQGIAGGEHYALEIADAIASCAAFLLLCSATSLASRNVKQEIALAWKYERAYVPLLLEHVTIPRDVEYWLEAAQWVEVHEKAEGEWLPQVLTALAPLGIAPAPPPPEAIRLAGREKELALLREKLASAKEGAGGLVLVGGEAGIGKTTLAEAALREAKQAGFTVLEGHCFDLADTPPYGPWVDLFAHLPATASLPPLPEAFAQRGTVGAVASQMALFVAVEDFLKAVAASQSVVVLLDDLHWSDPASLDLLRFLARSVAGLPLLILVTYRSDELTRKHPLYALLPQLAREAGAERIDLSRLDDGGVRALIDERYHLPDADATRLVSYLQGRAEGNALFVGELLRALEEGGVLARDGDGWRLADLAQTSVPTLLRQVIEGRLARLDNESQRLLAVASVIGHDVPLDVWATVGETNEDTLLDLTERAEEASLLIGTPDGTGVRFAHALIREALYEGVPSVRRRRLHRLAGHMLGEAGSPDPDAVAMHFQKAGDARAVAWLVKAGERAQLAYAWLTAIERYEAALALLEAGDGDLGERGWLRYRIARLRRVGTPRQGIEYLDEALHIAATVGDRALAAAARYSRGLCLYFAAEAYEAAIGDMAAGADALEALSPDEQERLDLRPDEWGVPTATNPRGMLVWVLATAGHVAEALAMGEVTREGTPRHTALGELGWAHHGDRYVGLGLANAFAGHPDAARDAFERGRDLFRSLGHFGTLNAATGLELVHVSLPYRTEQPDERRRLVEEGVEANGRAHTMRHGHAIFSAHIPVLALSGRWAEALMEAEAAQRDGDIAHELATVTLVLCQLARHRGETEEAWAHIRAQLPEGPQVAPGTLSLWERLALTQLAVALALDDDDLVTAKEWLDADDHWLAWSGAVLGRSEGQALWAHYYRQERDADKAYAHAERALTYATDPRQPLALIAAHRLLGELGTDAGRFADAATHLDASVALADACHAPYERALTLLAMAERRAATGEIETARTLLAEVKAICEPLGATPTLTRADALLARMGSG